MVANAAAQPRARLPLQPLPPLLAVLVLVLVPLAPPASAQQASANTSGGGFVADFSDLAGESYTVSWDSRSMRLNGNAVLLQSGSIHYPRSTPSQWPHLFAEARAAGLNTIECYVFWNFHARAAPQAAGAAAAPGGGGVYAYDYTGSGDVALFLELAAKNNLFVIWRFGPYVHGPARTPRRPFPSRCRICLSWLLHIQPPR